MSEYQHYQFLAADRPLTDEQLTEIRKLTTRAALTRTTFLNTYQWGDFKGNCDQLMERYYDGHLYFANWGYRRIILRWPAQQLPLSVAERYCSGESAKARKHGKHVLITLVSDDEDCELDDFNDLFDFSDYGQDSGREEEWLPTIARARPDVAAGDLRLLYLAWLLCLGNGDLNEDEVEPPLPAGLAALPEPLVDLATFLRIDPDLISAAAALSPPPSPHYNNDQHTVADLRRRFSLEHPDTAPVQARRTVAQLKAAALASTAQRLTREERERADHEEAQRQLAQAAQRARIDVIEGDPEAAWKRVHEMIAHQRGRNYPAAVQLLEDLAVLAGRNGTTEAFTARYRALRKQHPTKRALLRLLDAAKL
ncbi:hypothetical protein [Streptomyces sp. NPDC052015]|uniref:hypothetical protein n=1 Tax=Streptomyces sp. NPDC052015 TaxID=3154755 RepID=UPI00343E6F6F